MRSGRRMAVVLAFMAAVVAGCGRGPVLSASLPSRVAPQAFLPPTNPVVTPNPKPNPNWPPHNPHVPPHSGGKPKCYPHVPCLP